jgi:arabinan endo-1,5-alpha-L-arabinosidase
MNPSPLYFYTKWSVYNVHDPSIKKFGEYYYSYSTDWDLELMCGLEYK